MRHRQPKGPETDRPVLNHRVTSRLYPFSDGTPYRSHPPRSRSVCLSGVQSRAQTLDHRTHHRGIHSAFQSDPHLTRQVDTDRTRTRYRSGNRLGLNRSLLTNLHRQQLDGTRRPGSKTTGLIQTPPLEYLVGVNPVLQRNPSYRRALCQRLLYDQATLPGTPPSTRRRDLTSHPKRLHLP